MDPVHAYQLKVAELRQAKERMRIVADTITGAAGYLKEWESLPANRWNGALVKRLENWPDAAAVRAAVDRWQALADDVRRLWDALTNDRREALLDPAHYGIPAR